MGLAVLAGVLAGCVRADQPLRGATAALPGKPAAVAPWQTRASAAAEGVRTLTEPEGDLVMASAIAAHEMRRP